MAKTKNTAEPMDETPEVLEEITEDLTPDLTEEPAIEEPDVIEEPLPLEEVETEDAPGIVLLADSDSDEESPLADIEPAKRIEFFLAEIATGLAELVPATRIEEFLHRIAVRLNTIYDYDPVVPDATGADVGKVMTAIAAAGDEPAKWGKEFPYARPGEGSKSIILSTYQDALISTGTVASGTYSLAFGVKDSTTARAAQATGNYAIALGASAMASGKHSVAIGDMTTASGDYSLAEITQCAAAGQYSHASGFHVTANGRSEMTIGEYAIVDTSEPDAAGRRKYLFHVGNGTGTNARSDALTVDWSGNLAAAGNVIAANIPAAPTANGTYKLTCTVTGGTPAYTWELEAQ